MSSGRYEECTPLAIFKPCAGSHPFDQRNVLVSAEGEEHATKIGRSVARCKANPNPSNAIFDCKVLSRNHAVLFYEDGAFYLRDTNSSNGTFVNSDRLSQSGEESAPRQIFSGDSVQLGVDIVEGGTDKAYGCIMSTIILYNDRGEEVLGDSSDRLTEVSETSTALPVPRDSVYLTPKQLFQMQHYIKEALFRERVLEDKLSILQDVLHQTVKASEDSWQALINEDRLLARIELLEGQLRLYSRSATPDSLHQQLADLLQERNDYEAKSKQILQLCEEDKREFSLRILDLERSLNNAEAEITLLNLKHEESVQGLLEENNKLKSEVVTLQEKLEAQAQVQAPSYAVNHEAQPDAANLAPVEKPRGLRVGPYSVQEYAERIGVCGVENFEPEYPVDATAEDSDESAVRGRFPPDRLSTITEESQENYSVCSVEKLPSIVSDQDGNRESISEEMHQELSDPDEGQQYPDYLLSQLQASPNSNSIRTEDSDVDYDLSDDLSEEDFSHQGFYGDHRLFNSTGAQTAVDKESDLFSDDGLGSEENAIDKQGDIHVSETDLISSAEDEREELGYSVHRSLSYREQEEERPDPVAGSVLVCSVLPLLGFTLLCCHVLLGLVREKSREQKED